MRGAEPRLGDGLSQLALLKGCARSFGRRRNLTTLQPGDLYEELDFVHAVHNTGCMDTAYVSGRVPQRFERLVVKQARAARTSKSNLVARYVVEKSLENEFPGISFRDSLSGREAHVTGRRVAVWEVVEVYNELGSVERTAGHFDWPPVLVKRALGYAKAFPEEIQRSREGERHGVPAVG
jgi:uncharacterized protein (DUF433 family)